MGTAYKRAFPGVSPKSHTSHVHTGHGQEDAALLQKGVMWAARTGRGPWPGAAALQRIWMLPQGMLGDGLDRAEKLIATLNVEQDHVREEAHSPSPAPVRVLCQDWAVEILWNPPGRITES